MKQNVYKISLFISILLIGACKDSVNEKIITPPITAVPQKEVKKVAIDTVPLHIDTTKLVIAVNKPNTIHHKKPLLKKIDKKEEIILGAEESEIVEKFDPLITFKSKHQEKIDSALALQIERCDSIQYGLQIGTQIPPFYFINENEEKKYLYGIASKFMLLYFSDTTAYAYREPFIDSIYSQWFNDVNFRKNVYTQHIALNTMSENMFFTDSLPGRSISNFKENYNNGGFDLKKLYKISSAPTYYLLDSTKRIVFIKPSLLDIQNILNQ